MTVSTPGTWDIDPVHSGIGFSIRHMVIAKVRGRFTKWTGTLHVDEAAPERSSVEVKIDASSIDTGTPDRDNHLRSADFFDVAKFPEITFKSTRVEKAGGDRYKVQGDLTMHGVTKPAVLDMEHGGVGKDPWGGRRSAFSAKTTVDRKDFGLQWNQALETGGLLVGDKVEIDIEVEAVQKVAAPAPEPAAAGKTRAR